MAPAEEEDEEQRRRQQQQQETIRVQLDESYFGRERRALGNLAANWRQQLSSLQLFNPQLNAQNVQRQEEEKWSQKEKYTLDSLNEIRQKLEGDQRPSWSQPADGREIWPSKLQYFLAITSYSIGLGNVIRFPILVQKNGGLAFLIPFVVMLVIEGIPLLYLELAIGQRMRRASISCWQLVSPVLLGIGLASAGVSFLVGLYYNIIVAWTLYYLCASMLSTGPQLPYATCPVAATAAATNATECQLVGSYQYFWFRETLDISGDASEVSSVNWSLLGCLAAAWLLSYLCLARNLSASKRLVYVSSCLPYGILVIFYLKVATLAGTSDGVAYFFQPNWSQLWSAYVWFQAAAQVFFSLGLGFGGLIALSSYNQLNNNCYQDAKRVAALNLLASLFAGLVLFSILGHRANLEHGRCLELRADQIQFYLADYQLKALDAAGPFEQVARGDAPTSQFDASDAIDSIRSLDRQLDREAAAASNELAAGSDVEFVLDTRELINETERERIIANIPQLASCSKLQELDRLSGRTSMSFVFVVLLESILQFDGGGDGGGGATWAVVLFVMLLALGLDSQLGNLEGLLSSWLDLAVGGATTGHEAARRRRKLTGTICGLSFLLSACLFGHGAGYYLFQLFDEYASNFSLVLVALFELLAVSHVYSLAHFADHCHLMTGRRPHFLVLFSWRYISPLLLLLVTVATLHQFTHELDYQVYAPNSNSNSNSSSNSTSNWLLAAESLESRPWPSWCLWLAAILVLGCVVWIPAAALAHLLGLKLLPEPKDTASSPSADSPPPVESARWFPAEELRDFHQLEEFDERKASKWERILFGFRDRDDDVW